MRRLFPILLMLFLAGCGGESAEWPRTVPVVEIRVPARTRGWTGQPGDRLCRFLHGLPRDVAAIQVDRIDGMQVVKLYGQQPVPVYQAMLPIAKSYPLPAGSRMARYAKPDVIGEQVEF